MNIEESDRDRGAGLWLATLTSVAGALLLVVNALGPNRPPALIAGEITLIAAAQALAIFSTWPRPSFRRLLVAAAVSFIAAAVWWTAHATGLPDADGRAWRLEATGFPDVYPSLLNLTAAFMFVACAVGRWPGASQGKRRLAVALAIFAALGLAAVGVRSGRIAEVLTAILVLDGGVPKSLLWFFLPAAAVALALGIAGPIWPRLRAATGLGWKGALALVPAMLALTLFAWGGVVAARESSWFSRRTPIRTAAGKTLTLAYCWPEGRPLAMDVSEPARGAPRLAPAVIYIHGGETLQGSRNLDDGSPDVPYFTHLRQRLVARGFVAVSIDYRLAPFNAVPDETNDASCAVRFLRANASVLGIDPDRIGAYGPSQGGYLAAMLGLASSMVGPENDEHPGRGSQVEAVVDMWGPTDLGDFRGSPKWVAAISGGSAHLTAAHLARIRAASPLYNVTPQAPPFLIIHGQDDWFIALHHSTDLAERLREDGADVTFIPVRGDGHGLAATRRGGREDPPPDVLVDRMVDFFMRTLGSR